MDKLERDYLLKIQIEKYKDHPVVQLNQDVKGIGKKGMKGHLYFKSDIEYVGQNRITDLPVVVIGKQNFKYINPRYLENVL